MARPRSPSRAGSEDPQSKLGEAYILLLLQVYGGIDQCTFDGYFYGRSRRQNVGWELSFYDGIERPGEMDANLLVVRVRHLQSSPQKLPQGREISFQLPSALEFGNGLFERCVHI